MNGPSDFVRQPEALRPRAAGAAGAAAGAGGASASTLSAQSTSLRAPPAKGYVRSPPAVALSPIRVRAPSPVERARVADGAGGGPGAHDEPPASIASLASDVLLALSPRDACLRSVPAAVHFAGGFEEIDAGGTGGGGGGGGAGGLRTIVRVRNVASEAQRVYVHPVDASRDDGRNFSVRVKNAGRVAPGLCQEFEASFRPTPGAAPRYYFASVRVVGEWGEVSVPLHAYPVATSFRFPQRVDFGHVALLDAAQRVVRLTAGVPIAFDFAFEPRVSHPDITVEPTSGTIPPGGFADVLIT